MIGHLDYNSLLLALGYSGICIGMTMLGTWYSARSERFMLTWAIGVMMIVLNVFVYDRYVASPDMLLGFIVLCSLTFGFATLNVAARQFSGHKHVLRVPLSFSLVTCATLIAFMAAGYDGIAFIILNLTAGMIHISTGWIYWRGRVEAPASIGTMGLLYALGGLSFIPCAWVLLADGVWVMGAAPQNWAENLNIIVVISAMTGIGALSLSVTHARLARRHRISAQTDPLTGLLNRRALFELHGQRSFSRFDAIVAFDLDGFKLINDAHGHAFGDEVLIRFADILREHARQGDQVARLGGEEFVMVMQRIAPEQVVRMAETVRTAFANTRFDPLSGPVSCTVSAGIGYGTQAGSAFDAVLKVADDALYTAKDKGRDTVVEGRLRLVG